MTLSGESPPPLDAGIVAGGVSVEALMSSVAPEGKETVSPELPISNAVPVLGSTLSTFNVLILQLNYL